MNPELTELLIGKFLDSEITPAEKRLLDEELKQNPQARQLLLELQQLHQQTQQVFMREIAEQGQPVEQIIQQALQKQPLMARQQRIRLSPWLHLAANVAAGFVLGFGVYHFFAHSNTPETIPAPQAPQSPVVQANPAPKEIHRVAEDLRPRLLLPGKTGRVDYYLYPDPSGSEWLIEAYRDTGVETASYHGDL